MKKTVTFLLLLAAAGLNAQTSSQAFVQASNQATQRLEKALDELDVIQAEVNDNRPKLGARLDQVEAEALRLRDDASNAARLKAGFDVEVSQLEKEKQSVIDTNNYIQLIIGLVIGGGSFFVFALVLRIEELRMLLRRFTA